MESLAADDMQGREPGTEGYARAVKYVEERFLDAGLQGFGDCGHYQQKIRFLCARPVPDASRFVLQRNGRESEFIHGAEFVSAPGFGPAREEITAPVVYLGYGISAPEYGHDDYVHVDVRGRVVVVLSGAPSDFDTDQRAFYASPERKQRLAASRGAVGLVTVRTATDSKRLPWRVVVTGSEAQGMRWLDASGHPFEGRLELAGVATVGEEGARRLRALTGLDLEEISDGHTTGGAGGIDLGLTATLARASEHSWQHSCNLVAALRGSDPVLRDEYLVYSAHLDHLGIRTTEGRTEIFNGAYDNAAGVGAVLEVASAMARMGCRPRRSILFVAFTAEEKGQQGSSFFTKNSPVPLDQIVANLNIDMPYLGFPVADLEPIGASHSTLEEAVAVAADLVGLEVTPDTMPEQVRFIRSDQFSFVKEGIPGLNLKPGSKCSDPTIDARAALNDYLRHHYHRSTDKLGLPYSYAGAQAYARAALALGLVVANQESRPNWKEGDFFGSKFGSRRRS